MFPEVIDARMLKRIEQTGLLKKGQLEQLHKEKITSEEPMTELILKHEFMSDVQLISFLAAELKCASINPNHFLPQEEVIGLLPITFAYKHRVLPIAKHLGTLTIAMENPTDIMLIDDIKAITNMRVRPAITLTREMNIALKRFFPQAEAAADSSSEETIQELVRIVQEQKNSP